MPSCTTGRTHAASAGTLTHDSGRTEAVAVKVVQTIHASEAERAAAKRELSLMGLLTRKLAGHVIALKGWHETGDCKLLIAMELADGSLHDALQALPDRRMAAQQWVRACALCDRLLTDTVATCGLGRASCCAVSTGRSFTAEGERVEV